MFNAKIVLEPKREAKKRNSFPISLISAGGTTIVRHICLDTAYEFKKKRIGVI